LANVDTLIASVSSSSEKRSSPGYTTNRLFGLRSAHALWKPRSTLGAAEGDLAGARPLFARALAICEQALGPDHPDTAVSLNSLGLLLRAQGDLAGARPLYARALAICEKALGPGHPETATVRRNLASLDDA
jgi:tetratricopeptide (TPR) repeat protein